METERKILRHFLAALAYRTQKALRGASPEFADFRAADGLRTPRELVRHMASVLGYAGTFFVGGSYHPIPLETFEAEVARLHAMLAALGGHLGEDWPGHATITAEQLLQGPLADVMTHAGQLALLRRLAGDPVAPENFVFARVDPDRLGSDQPDPARPDPVWPEAPPGWQPPD